MIEVHPVTPDRWEDLVELFEQPGPRGGHRNAPAYGCWCMWWRDRSLEHGEGKKRGMEELVRKGRRPGLLAYEDGAPVGWVSIAARSEYAQLLRSPQYRPREEELGVWAIVCFTIDKPARGKRIREVLLEAAVEHAFANGAKAVEAYAHKEKRDDYMGHVALYEAHGFERVRETGKRVVVRRWR